MNDLLDALRLAVEAARERGLTSNQIAGVLTQVEREVRNNARGLHHGMLDAARFPERANAREISDQIASEFLSGKTD